PDPGWGLGESCCCCCCCCCCCSAAWAARTAALLLTEGLLPKFGPAAAAADCDLGSASWDLGDVAAAAGCCSCCCRANASLLGLVIGLLLLPAAEASA